MTSLTTACLMGYVLYKIQAPWFVYIPLVVAFLFDTVTSVYRIGEENGEDVQ